MKKIFYANALLVPDATIQTRETGTRHKAAERTAKQIQTIVIAVSERKNKITLYYGNIKYELEGSSEILRRASETLQILEKQKELFDDSFSNLNILEINDLVTASDVANLLQRTEIIKRISGKVKRYLVELGKEGLFVSLRLKELIKNLGSERGEILKDYFKSKYSKIEFILDNLSFDYLIETANISKILFEEENEVAISSKGVRLLKKTELSDGEIAFLTERFKSLDGILSATDEEILEVLKEQVLVEKFHSEIAALKEKIMVEKSI